MGSSGGFQRRFQRWNIGSSAGSSAGSSVGKFVAAGSRLFAQLLSGDGYSMRPLMAWSRVRTLALVLLARLGSRFEVGHTMGLPDRQLMAARPKK